MKDWEKKQREFEQVKARAKELRLRLTCTICGEKAKLNCPCGTTQYCTVACQRIDWRDRGHRKACKKIRDERAAEAARAEAPTPPPSPPVFGPAPRSHADEIRARIAAEHEAARARREANPEPEPKSARIGSRCPICLEEWDVNSPGGVLRVCCCRKVCNSCQDKIGLEACPLCRIPYAETDAEDLARLRRHVENEVPEAFALMGGAYNNGWLGLVPSPKKSAKFYKRGVELGNVESMLALGFQYEHGEGVKKDRKKSMQLYRMAAVRGDACAQTNLAHYLVEDGEKEEAFRLYQLSADQGYATAQLHLGTCYAHGNGVEGDILKSLALFKQAAEGGDEDAQRHYPGAIEFYQGRAEAGFEDARALLLAHERGQ